MLRGLQRSKPRVGCNNSIGGLGWHSGPPQYNDHDLVFCWEDGRPRDPGNVSKAFRKALDGVGLDRAPAG